ncbi:hypothetical protein [Flavobacterium sp.]|uniref:hypothetical protein n=1 Tax=Flavobacterium sp. TaxID=239 RepID=UPI00404760A8
MKNKLIYLAIILFTLFACKENKSENINNQKTTFKTIQNSESNKNENFNELKLINRLSTKEMNLFNIIEVDLDNIIKTFGKPLEIEKENKIDLNEGEEPWTIVKYDGIEIEFTGKYISVITIDNINWSISNIEIGKTNSDIEKFFKNAERKHYEYTIYEIQNFEGVFFSKFDKDKKIVEFGISVN